MTRKNDFEETEYHGKTGKSTIIQYDLRFTKIFIVSEITDTNTI